MEIDHDRFGGYWSIFKVRGLLSLQPHQRKVQVALKKPQLLSIHTSSLWSIAIKIFRVGRIMTVHKDELVRQQRMFTLSSHLLTFIKWHSFIPLFLTIARGETPSCQNNGIEASPCRSERLEQDRVVSCGKLALLR
jgi:hypothetical protein